MNIYDKVWLHYLELPRKTNQPVKINKILEKRMRDFRERKESQARPQSQIDLFDSLQ